MGLLTHYSDLIEAGCDEAGRGCLAGPVVAAAVILRKDSDFPELNDSKQLTEKKRMQLRELVMQEALTYGVGIVSAQEIDEINILNASFLDWKKNKGYPTREHKQAIADYGTTPLHRMTFNMAIQLKLDI